MLREALGAASVKIAVRDQCTVERDANLAAVRVPRDDQVVAVVRHRVDHPAVRRVRDANRDIDLVMINRPGDLRIPILIKVGIVGPAESKPDTLDLQRGARMRQVDPAGLLEAVCKILPRQRAFGKPIASARPFRYRSGFLNFGA